jgi:Protein of unknown function (DUF4197)
MERFDTTGMARRGFLVAAGATGALAVSGCASLGGSFGMVDAVRRLLVLSSGRALSRLTAADGYWNSAVGRIALPELFGNRGGVIASILTSDIFRERLQHRLNNFAEVGARRAAPAITDTVRTIGIENAVAIIRGGPTAATTFLRQAMGPAVINAMVPGLSDAIQTAGDPLISQAVAALTGVNIGDVAHSLALGADNGLWYEIGASEADIRAHPEQTNDPILIAALKVL